MIDLKFIRENPEAVRQGAASKNITVPIDVILKLDAERRSLIAESEKLRAEQNRESEGVAAEKDPAARQKMIDALKKTKEAIKELQERLDAVNGGLDKQLRLVPNLPLPDVKVGKDDSENYTLRTFGQPTSFSFKPKDYIALGEALDMIDTDRAAKVAGARFGYLKNEAALLEFALIQYAFSVLSEHKFVPVVPPVMINEKSLGAMGYLERGGDEIYHLEHDDLYLIGTSEHVLGPMHSDEVFMETELPRRYAGFSTCFRREAGSYGKDVRGILRVHQFDKVEMFSFTLPEHSAAEHELLLSVEEKLMQGLGLPYRVVGIVSGDLGDPAAKKYDIEAWVPSQNTYRETHSTSNCTDWQARRLNVRIKRKSGALEFAHTLNGTAFAIGRTIIAIMENYQREDGSIGVPPVLVPYIGGRTVIGAK